MGRLFLHIGYPKAGSSALQTALLASRARLRRHGIFFPNAADGLCNAFTARFHDEPATLHPYVAISDPSQRADAIARDSERLFRRVAQNSADTVILSSESLIGLDAEAVRAVRRWAAEHFEAVLILCYVREPVSYATSLTQERVKQGLSLREACEMTPTGNFAVSIPKWVDAFGAAAVRVRSVEALPGRDVVSDVFGLMGCDGPAGRAGYANPAMSAEATRMIGAIHALDAKAPGWLRALPGTVFRLPDEMIERVRAQAAPGLAYLAAEWGITFDAPGPVPPEDMALGERTLAYLAEHLAVR